MKKTMLVVSTILLSLSISYAQFFGAIPVFDASNFANALDRYIELQKQYAQLVATYKQLVLEYKHMLWMATRLPRIWEYRSVSTPWRYSSSSDTYGTTGGWTAAVNSGIGVIQGYNRAVEALLTYGAALGRIPSDQLSRARTQYASVELADAANLHAMEVLGLQRGRARSTEDSIDRLEGVSLSGSDENNTEIAVLNKINIASIISLRASQQTNQLLVSLLEQQITDSKARRDAAATEINRNIAFRLNAEDVSLQGIRGTTTAITAFRMP